MKIISKKRIEALGITVTRLELEEHEEEAELVQDLMLDDLADYMAVAPEAEGVRNDICEHAGLSVGPAGLLN